MKKCRDCQELFPKTPEHFYRDISRYDSLDCRCKKCSNKAKTVRRLKKNKRERQAVKTEREKNKDLAREKAKRYYKDGGYLCSVMGCDKKHDHLHHIDYNKPLEVIPLCARHHRSVHEEYWK